MSSMSIGALSWITNIANLRMMSMTLLFMMVAVRPSLAKEEREVHRYMQCDYLDGHAETPCGLGYFCGFQSDELSNSTCERCPAPSLAEEECKDGLDHLSNKGVQYCLESCLVGDVGDPCDANATCAHDKNLFCNFGNGNGTGTCEKCKSDVSQCLSTDLGLPESGIESCLECDLNCWPYDFSEVTVDGKGIDSFHISGSPSLSVSGPLADCTNLVYKNEPTCPGANNSVCLIEDVTKNMLNYEVVWKCERSGGIAAMLFGSYLGDDSDEPFDGYLSFKATRIPSVTISISEGRRLRTHKIGALTNVTVSNKVENFSYHVSNQAEDFCWREQRCSESIPCVGRRRDAYCAFDWVETGWCWKCPVDEKGDPDPYACFFDRKGGNDMRQNEVQSCAEKCGSSLKFDSCKFCPRDMTAFSFGVDRESDRCRFCPMDDVKYPEREVPLFGEGTKCWQMQEFFETVEVHASSQNCQLAQMMNYICGCEGPGYGGASTETKKRLLAWLPRVMAILSFLGSSFIIFDAWRSRDRGQKTFKEIMAVLSVFDLFGSCAYAFTSLPIPADDYIFGSIGNEASCKAQGFFIQLGTISCYTNVSLSVYYMLVIKMGWSERRVKKVRFWLVLVPLLIGMAFAFAGIPFYDDMILWCNNAASWWPDISVAVAIALATIIMTIVCFDVYKKEKASARWRGGASVGGTRSRNTVANRVFWQSVWYLMAFYLTWPPYLALQYSWASGKAYSNYGLILFAGITVPLQGLSNFFVYVRPRYAQDVGRKLRQSLPDGLARYFARIQSSAELSSSTTRAGSSISFRLPSQTSSPRGGRQESAEHTKKNEKSDGKETAVKARPLTTIQEWDLMREQAVSSPLQEDSWTENMSDDQLMLENKGEVHC